MTIYSVLEFSSALALLWLAITIFQRNPYDNFHKTVAAALFLLFFAIFCEFRINVSQDLPEATILAKFADVFWNFTAAALLHAMLIFRGSQLVKNRFFLYALYAPMAIFALIILFSDITYANFMDSAVGIYYVRGFFYLIFLITDMLYLLTSILLCYLVFRSSTEILKRKQALFMLIAFIIPLLTGLAIIFTPNQLKMAFPSFMSISVAFAGVFAAITEERYRLFPKYPQMAGENIFNFLPDILLVTDINNRVNLASKSFLNFIGLENGEQIYNKPLAEVLENRSVAEFLNMSVMKGDKMIRDCPLALRDRIFSLNAAQIRDNTLDKIGMVTIGRDVTERKRNESELKKNNETLEENLREIDRLNRIFTERELEMSQLKEEIKKLKAKLNRE